MLSKIKEIPYLCRRVDGYEKQSNKVLSTEYETRKIIVECIRLMMVHQVY